MKPYAVDFLDREGYTVGAPWWHWRRRRALWDAWRRSLEVERQTCVWRHRWGPLRRGRQVPIARFDCGRAMFLAEGVTAPATPQGLTGRAARR